MNIPNRTPPTRVHLVTWMDATEAVIEPMAVDSLNSIEDARAIGGNQLTGEMMLERKAMPFGRKMATGVIKLGALVAAGASVALGAGLAIGGSPLLGLGLAAAGAGVIHRFGTSLFMRGAGHVYSAMLGRKMAEPAWSGIRTYEVTANTSKALDSRLVSEKPLEARRDLPSISDFLANGMKKYPRQDVTVVHMMGHGLGYRQAAGLPYKDYRTVMDETVQKAGRPIDVLLLESCLEGNLEAVAGIGDRARFVLVSQETINAGVMGNLLLCTTASMAGKTFTPAKWGKTMVESVQVLGGHSQPETLALVDTQKLPAVVQALDELGALLQAEIGTNAEALTAAVKATQLYPKDWPHRSTGEKLGMGDLGHFCRNLQRVYLGKSITRKSGLGPFSSQSDVKFPQAAASPRAAAILEAAVKVREQVDEAVIARHTAQRYDEACGLSVQLPTSSLARLDKKLMPFTDSAAPPNWQAFVRTMSARV
ncbi:hypothetical protein DYH09_00070 [bacterium CPR1]|nr:hypothetical protein [bacterium CPR1]